MNDKVNVRMCFVCRNYLPKEKMLRITKNNGEAFLDKSLKSGGRGSYLCSAECLKKARKTKRINSLPGCSVSEEFLDKLESEFENG
ncbi:MAG: YlxR family protein [Clostridia bacterium]|nr:YlxR family protein [Clostridia bacterium]